MEDLQNVYVCKKRWKGDLRIITKGKFDKGSRSLVVRRKLNCEYFEVQRPRKKCVIHEEDIY
jgi:hypothetical protein